MTTANPQKRNLPPGPRPLLARLTAPPGPPSPALLEADGAVVMAVPGRYSVCYLLVSLAGITAVDVGSAADVDPILDAVRWLGRPPSDLRWVTMTHLHMDHVMGIRALGQRTGARLVLGPVAAEQLAGEREARWPPRWKLLRALPTWVMQGAPLGAPEDLIDGWGYGFPWSQNNFELPLTDVVGHGSDLPGAPGWTLLETPGHSDDSVCFFHEEAAFLVAGDTIRNFLGGEWNPLLTDVADFEQTRAQLGRLHVRAALPGHGPVIEDRRGVLERLRTVPKFLP